MNRIMHKNGAAVLKAEAIKLSRFDNTSIAIMRKEKISVNVTKMFVNNGVALLLQWQLFHAWKHQNILLRARCPPGSFRGDHGDVHS